MRRLAWSLFGLTLALIGLTLVLEALNHRLTGEDAPAGYGVAVMAITFTAVGAVVGSRRPENPIGWIFCAVGLLQAVNLSGVAYAHYAAVTRPGALPAAESIRWFVEWCWMPSVAALATFLLLLFPDGRLPSPRWRWLAWPTAAAIVFVVAAAAVELWPERRALARGLDVPEDDGSLFAAGFGVIFLSAIASAASVVVRFRRSTGVERQQLKWFMFAAALAVASVASAFMPAGELEAVAALGLVGVLSIPVATGVAILRHRLYDIDRVINRTLVYGALTAILAGAYLGCVLLFQLALRPLTEANSLAIAGSTLAVAALFRPARARIQATVDRRFYRGRYDAQRTLDAFTTRLRDELDLDAMGADVRAVVRETMQPAHVSLWLRSSR